MAFAEAVDRRDGEVAGAGTRGYGAFYAFDALVAGSDVDEVGAIVVDVVGAAAVDDDGEWYVSAGEGRTGKGRAPGRVPEKVLSMRGEKKSATVIIEMVGEHRGFRVENRKKRMRYIRAARRKQVVCATRCEDEGTRDVGTQATTWRGGHER